MAWDLNVFSVMFSFHFRTGRNIYCCTKNSSENICLRWENLFFQIPEFDNLYLDMNGIIHMCSHPEDDNPHFRITEEKIFEAIFHYIEVWNNPTTYETGRNCSEQQFSRCNEWSSLRIDPILFVLGLVQNDTSQEGILHGYRWSCTKGKNESAKRSSI